jgi:hypothetical protein
MKRSTPSDPRLTDDEILEQLARNLQPYVILRIPRFDITPPTARSEDSGVSPTP